MTLYPHGPRERISGHNHRVGVRRFAHEDRGYWTYADVREPRRTFGTIGVVEGEELETNILRAPGKPAGGSRCKFCTLRAWPIATTPAHASAPAVLARLPDHPAKRIHDLLPWNWRPQNIAAEAA